MEMDTGRQHQKDTPMRIFTDLLCMIKDVCKAFALSIYRFFIAPDKKSVKNEIVLVTGSASGVGRELSKEFAKLGAIVVLWDVDISGNEETAKQIKELGGTCHNYTCDVSDRHDVYKCGDRVKSDLGDVSILVNNAARVTGQRLIDCPDDLIEKTFDVNLMGHFWTIKCFLPAMLKNNHGHVVTMSSSVGFIGLKNLADYCASKFGTVGMTEVLNYEIIYAGYTGVYTTLVCPSYLKTGMFEGCRIRFPQLCPPLEVKPTVNRIMQGILTNQSLICIPRSVYLLNILKTILPVDVMVEIIKFSGAATFMDNFLKHRRAAAAQDKGDNQKPNGLSNPNDTETNEKAEVF